MSKNWLFVLLLCTTSCSSVSKKIGGFAAKEIGENIVEKSVKEEGEQTAKHLLGKSAKSAVGSRISKNAALKQAMGIESKALRTGVGKIISRHEGKDVIIFLEKNNPGLAKQLKNMMKEGGPFHHPDYQNFICEVGEHGDLIIRNPHPDALSSAIRVKGNTITAYSGGTKKCGASNMFLDKPLPNKKYVVDDGKYVFSTDAKGRTSSVVAKYDESVTDIKPPLDDGRRKMGVLDKGGNTKIHDAGHITQHNQGGINESINLVPMNNSWQRSGGAWREFEVDEEKIIAEAIRNGKTVTSTRQLVYSGDSQIPSSIIVKVMVDGKSKIAKTLVCPN